MVEPIVPALGSTVERRPLLGYLMVTTAATLFAINGAVAKVILTTGISSLRLAEVRSTGAVVGLGLALVVARRDALRLRARELPLLALFGLGGLAVVQWAYFLAIHRLAIGVALLIQYLAPLLVALWARYVRHESVRRRIWAALALALTGLALIVRVWSGLALDAVGVAASLLAAGAYALYILVGERGVAHRDPVSFTAFGFAFAALFWAVVQPWWSFPAHIVALETSLHGHLAGTHAPVWVLMAWMVVAGTILPFALVVGALRHISATRAGIAAMLEPVAGAVVAWAWLGETLSALELVGGAVVLTGIVLAQTAR